MCLELFSVKVLKLHLFLGLFMCLWTEAIVVHADMYSSPCPNTFRYQLDENGQLYGTIGVYTLDENVVRINVELSVGNHVDNYNGRIELAFPKDKVIDDIFHQRPVKYKLFFPRWENMPPKVTKIVVNGQTVCSGPPISMGSWINVLTTINLEHTLFIKTVPLEANSNPFLPSNSFTRNQNEDFSPKGENGEFGRKDVNNKPQVPKDSFNSNPFLKSFTTTTTSTTTIRPNSIPSNDFQISKNPFLSGKISPSNANYATSRPSESPTSSPRHSQFRPTTEFPKPKQSPTKQSRFSTSSSETCGLPIVSNPLVVNGASVPRGAFPWLAAIFSVTSTGLEYKCSGSLISKKHVVTAAHCVEQGRKRIRADRLVLVLGKLNIKRWGLAEGEKIIEAEDIKVHPDYVPLTSDADIAVIALSEEIEFNRYIRPICLWSESDDLDVIVGEKGKVIGWGKDEHNNNMTAEPRQTTVPIVSQEQCLRSAEAFKYVTSERTFCAGDRDGAGPCNGDSGSGFIMKRDGRWVLRGVVSISTYDQNTQTCDLSNYVVFTDASKFKSWLYSFII